METGCTAEASVNFHRTERNHISGNGVLYKEAAFTSANEPSWRLRRLQESLNARESEVLETLRDRSLTRPALRRNSAGFVKVRGCGFEGMYWPQLANNIIILQTFLKHDNKLSGFYKNQGISWPAK
jgi:hypothetical protein